MTSTTVRRPWYFPLLLLVFLLAWWGLWFMPYLREMRNPSFQVGQPARRTVVAPRKIVFVSKNTASPGETNQVAAVSPDTALFLEHRSRFIAVLEVISLLRQAEFLSEQEKIQDLTLLEPLNLSPEEARFLLALPETSWKRIRLAALALFNFLIQRQDLSTDPQILQDMVRQRLPLDLAQREQMWVERLVLPYVQAYALYPSAVRSQVRVYQPGEIIIRQGETVTPEVYRVLQELGLVVEAQTLTDLIWDKRFSFFGLASWSLLWGLYVWRTPAMWLPSRMAALVIGFLAVLAHVRLWFPLVYNIPWVGFSYPFALYPLLVHLFFGPWAGVMWGFPLLFSGLVDHLWAESLLTYHTMSALAGFVLLNKPQGIFEYLKAALGMTVVGMWVLVGYVPHLGVTFADVSTWLPLPFFTSMITMGLTVFIEYGLSWLSGRVTRLHLLDLVRPEHPLLRRLAEEAEGTYQHSLAVATLAEHAARAIGADAFLCRVGGLYHDIGKLKRPHFFTENQTPDMTVSMPSDPYRMARIIREHVFYGLQLASQYRLPRRIRDFIAEHHGTTLVWVPYVKAVEAAGGDASKVPIDAFAYPGPKPRSRETAILMLADICEARVRSQQPKSEEEIREIVRDSVNLRFREGELDLSGLSIRDLRLIEDAFVQVLMGMMHGRVRYPKAPREKAEAKEPRIEPSVRVQSSEEEPTLIAPRGWRIPSEGKGK